MMKSDAQKKIVTSVY